jgi:hypothetical protein
MDCFKKIEILYWWLLSSFSDWKKEVWKRDLNELYCCNGNECGCAGQTVGEVFCCMKKEPTQ